MKGSFMTVIFYIIGI